MPFWNPDIIANLCCNALHDVVSYKQAILLAASHRHLLFSHTWNFKELIC